MNPILAVVAVVVSAGAIVGVSAREARAAVVGVAVVLVAAPFLGDPLPPLPTLATRVVGAALAAYLLRAAVASASDEAAAAGRDQPGSGTRTGWPTQALLAVGAAIAGIVASANLAALNPAAPRVLPGDVLGMLTAASLATAAGLAVLAVAVVPALLARNAVRAAIGFVLLTQGIVLVRTGVAGMTSDLEQLAGLVLTIAAAATGAIVIRLFSAIDPDEPSGGSGRRRSPVARPGALAEVRTGRDTRRTPVEPTRGAVSEPQSAAGEPKGDAG